MLTTRLPIRGLHVSLWWWRWSNFIAEEAKSKVGNSNTAEDQDQRENLVREY